MIKILQMADIHFGVEDAEALEGCAHLIAKVKPDIIAVCGDITQRGKRREFDAGKRWLDQLGAPYIITPGNHDTPLLDIWARVNQPFERFHDCFRHETKPMRVGNEFFATLNTSRGWQARRNWAEGVVNLQDLERVLACEKENRGAPEILICHHPFLSPPQTPLKVSTRRGASACERVARSQVELVLTGHVHAPSVIRRAHQGGSYLAVSAGTLSRRLRNQPPSVNVIRMDEHEIDIVTWAFIDAVSNPTRQGKWTRKDLSPV